MKIVITNAVLNNTGDAAIVQGIMRSLLDEGVCSEDQITILDSNSEVSRGLYPHWRILQQPAIAPPNDVRAKQRAAKAFRYLLILLLIMAPARFRDLLILRGAKNYPVLQSLYAVMSADVVISSGGTYLVDHYDFRPRTAEMRLAAALGKPVFLWTQSMGPFRTNRAKRTIKTLRNVVSGVYFRDDKSRVAWQRNLPLPAMHAIVPDVVFSLVNTFPLVDTEARPSERSTFNVALSVRDWSTTMEGKPFDPSVYRNALRHTARRLLTDDFVLTAISTCQGTPGYTIDDAVTARRIFQGLDLSIDGGHHTPDQLVVELAKSDFVIATRMHFAILSIIAGKPVAAIAYEFKTKELFESIGLKDWVIEIENVSPEWILSRIEEMRGNQDAGSLSVERRRQLSHDARIPATHVAHFVQADESSIA